MAITWIRFNRAMRVQGIDRNEYLPTPSRFQPYAGYWALFWASIFLWVQGYAVFLSGNWNGACRFTEVVHVQAVAHPCAWVRAFHSSRHLYLQLRDRERLTVPNR